MNLKKFLHISIAIDKESRKSLAEFKCTRFVGKVRTINNLDTITYGDLIELKTIENDVDAILIPCRVLLGMSDKEIYKADYREVIGFINMVRAEITRIDELFAGTRIEPTKEEKQAGCENLSFGVFGVLDWYCRRMGITNHDEVLRIGWVRIYQTLTMEKEEREYQRRLQNILYKK